jgi:ATP-dependent HslUV protease ATP-binding subunit HslU
MILKTPRNALTKQYEAMVDAEGATLSFTDEAIEEIADMAFNVNQEMENIGARRLHTIMSNLLNEILFDLPDRTDTRAFVIDKAFVQKKLKSLTVAKDLNHYIL